MAEVGEGGNVQVDQADEFVLVVIDKGVAEADTGVIYQDVDVEVLLFKKEVNGVAVGRDSEVHR